MSTQQRSITQTRITQTRIYTDVFLAEGDQILLDATEDRPVMLISSKGNELGEAWGKNLVLTGTGGWVRMHEAQTFVHYNGIFATYVV